MSISQNEFDQRTMRVWTHIVQQVSRDSYPPRRRDMSKALGMCNASIQLHVDRLVSLGALSRQPHCARALRVLKLPNKRLLKQPVNQSAQANTLPGFWWLMEQIAGEEMATLIDEPVTGSTVLTLVDARLWYWQSIEEFTVRQSTPDQPRNWLIYTPEGVVMASLWLEAAS